MFPISKAALLPLLAIASIQPLFAQSTAQSHATAASYRSVLSEYRAFAESKVAPWSETNERVRQRGGWRAYAREADPAMSVTPATPTGPKPTMSEPAAGGHSGHKMR